MILFIFNFVVDVIQGTTLQQVAIQPPQQSQSMITSLDGNVQLQDTPVLGTNKIRINITKNVAKNVTTTESTARPIEVLVPARPVIEEEILFEYKDSMRGAVFTKLPEVRNGLETSGLCSIM